MGKIRIGFDQPVSAELHTALGCVVQNMEVDTTQKLQVETWASSDEALEALMLDY